METAKIFSSKTELVKYMYGDLTLNEFFDLLGSVKIEEKDLGKNVVDVLIDGSEYVFYSEFSDSYAFISY